MSTSGRRERGFMLAACAVAMATAVGSSGTGHGAERQAKQRHTAPGNGSAESRAIQQIERYCTASWRNAGLKRQDWDDCTQQALVELLSTLSRPELTLAIEQPESAARRELNRAVWRLVKRCRRQIAEVAFLDAHAATRDERTEDDEWQSIELAASDCLTARQRQILSLTRDGWHVAEIAEECGTTSARVSDEKYKAIAKLRNRMMA